MANKMLAIMASYLLALLTRRVLLVDVGNGVDVRELFLEPFPGSSWALPADAARQLSEAKDAPLAWKVIPRHRKVIKVARFYTSKSTLPKYCDCKYR